MKSGRRVFLFTCVLGLALAACGAPATEEHPHWSYEGEGGPEHWGSLEAEYEACATGLQQSPVDLSGEVLTDLANIEFNYQPSEVNILNNGHTIQVNYDEGSSIVVDGHEYALVQFHFHAPSEHTVDGHSFPAEIHLVHSDANGALAVVGVFMELGSENADLQSVWDHMPAEESEAADAGTTVDAAELLPESGETYRYPGSLTTPPCSEGVSWFVMAEPIQISEGQLDAFQAIMSANNRPVQALGERELILDSTP